MSMSAAEDSGQSRPWALGVLAVLAGVGLVLGLWSFLPYFELEHRRLEPWKRILIWAGDAIALGWFLRFLTEHLVQGRPLQSRLWDSFKREKEWQLALASLLAGLGLDLALTLSLMHEDQAAFAGAVVVEGQADAVQESLHPVRNHYELHVTYQDRQGRQHEGRFMVEEPAASGFPPAVPAATVNALRDRRVPFAVRVSYDPSWPDRAWLTDFGPDDGNRLHYFSLIALVLQGAGLVLFVEVLAMVIYHTGRVPWWFDLYRALPFLAEVAFAALVGPFYRMEGFWVWA